MLAWIIAAAVVDARELAALQLPLLGLLAVFALRALVGGVRGVLTARASGEVRQQLRSELLDRKSVV